MSCWTMRHMHRCSFEEKEIFVTATTFATTRFAIHLIQLLSIMHLSEGLLWFFAVCCGLFWQVKSREKAELFRMLDELSIQVPRRWL